MLYRIKTLQGENANLKLKTSQHQMMLKQLGKDDLVSLRGKLNSAMKLLKANNLLPKAKKPARK